MSFLNTNKYRQQWPGALAGFLGSYVFSWTWRWLWSSKVKQLPDPQSFHLVHKPSSGLLSTILGDDNDCLSFADSDKFLSKLRLLDKSADIKIYIDTPGGLLAAAETIASALLQHEGKIDVYVSHKAYSAGTLLALCGTTIWLKPGACLAPVDPQMSLWITAVSARNLVGFQRDSNTWLGDLVHLLMPEAKQAIERVAAILERICEKRGYDKEKIVKHFLNGGYNHDQPFFYDTLCTMVNVKLDCPKKQLEAQPIIVEEKIETTL